MDFKLVLEKLLNGFREHQVGYALMGGFALALWGVPRATVDLDFLMRREDLGKVHEIMTALGYILHHHTENVSQYVSEVRILGQIDFLHAFRSATLSMLKRAVDKEIFQGEAVLKVLCVEDLIGLKVQAMANDETRRSQDLADIEALLALHGNCLDRQLILEYFDLFGWGELGLRLWEEYGPVI